MKKFLYAVMAFAAISFAACDKPSDEGSNDDDDNKTTAAIEALMTFKGEVTVGSEPAFTDQGVEWQLKKHDDSDEYTLLMNQTRFANDMPLLDMTIEGMDGSSFTEGDAQLLFTADSIVPSFMGREMPNYTMTEFEIKVDAETMTASMVCANNGTPLKITYAGNRTANPQE